MKRFFILVIACSLPLNLVSADEFKKHNSDKIKFSNSTIPYLVDHPKKAAMNTFNNELKSVLSRLRCRAPGKIKDKTFWETYTGIGIVTEKLISIKIRSNYNCDNLKTVNNEDASITFDFDTRRVLSLSDLFLKKENTMKFFRRHLYESLTSKNCIEKLSFYIESENLFRDHLLFYLAPKHLVLQMKIPFGLKSCISDQILIPFDEIKKSSSYTSTLKSVLQ